MQPCNGKFMYKTPQKLVNISINCAAALKSSLSVLAAVAYGTSGYIIGGIINFSAMTITANYL